MSLGWVPFYVENKARGEAGYTIPEWKALTPFERAQEVALFRVTATMDYVRDLESKRNL